MSGDCFLASLVQAKQELEKQFQELRPCLHVSCGSMKLTKALAVMLEVIEEQVKGFWQVC